MNDKVIIGCDPSNSKTKSKKLAFAILDTDCPECVRSTHYVQFQLEDTQDLWDFGMMLAGWTELKHRDIVLAIEKPYLGLNVENTMKLSFAVGYIKAVFDRFSKQWNSLEFQLVPPASWMNSIGLTHPKREQVLSYVCKYVQSVFRFKTDNIDIAAAICIADYVRREIITKERINP